MENILHIFFPSGGFCPLTPLQRYQTLSTKEQKKKCPCHISFLSVPDKYTFTWQICTYSQKSACILFHVIEPFLVLSDHLPLLETEVQKLSTLI